MNQLTIYNQLQHLSIARIRQVFATWQSQNLPRHWLDGWLLAVINQPSVFLITDGDYVPTDDEMTRLSIGIVRMMDGEPLAYLTGMQGFWGREFVVNAHTLIPRADTEILIETVLGMVKQGDISASPAILDLGTGSGCIGITLALELPSSSVVAVDYSDEALAVASQNADRLGADNCTLIRSDWYSAIDGVFDIIVSNPPYIAKDDTHMAALTHEPVSALVADQDGLADIITIADGAHRHLRAGGLLVIEHGYDQGMAVREILTKAGFAGVRTVKDYGDNDRITLGFGLSIDGKSFGGLT